MGIIPQEVWAALRRRRSGGFEQHARRDRDRHFRTTGRPAGTRITYVNPNGGRTETVTFAAFNAKYELPGAVKWAFPIVHWPAGSAVSAQNSLYSHSYTFDSPSVMTRPRSGLSTQQFLPALVAGIEFADAAQIGLAAISIVQAQASASQGSFVLSYDKAQRLLTPEGRTALPQIGKTNALAAPVLYRLLETECRVSRRHHRMGGERLR